MAQVKTNVYLPNNSFHHKKECCVFNQQKVYTNFTIYSWDIHNEIIDRLTPICSHKNLKWGYMVQRDIDSTLYSSALKESGQFIKS